MSHEMSPQLGREPLMRPDGERSKRWWPRPTAEERHGARVAGYVVAIVVNLILIAIARSIPSWGLPFVTPAFGEILPAIERSLVVAVVANAILCAYDATWFRHLGQVVMNAFALSAAVAIAQIFPFDLGSPGSNDLARLMVLLVAVAVVVAIFAEVVQMLLALAGRGQGPASSRASLSRAPRRAPS
jgi:hypothetical protein